MQSLVHQGWVLHVVAIILSLYNMIRCCWSFDHIMFIMCFISSYSPPYVHVWWNASLTVFGHCCDPSLSYVIAIRRGLVTCWNVVGQSHSLFAGLFLIPGLRRSAMTSQRIRIWCTASCRWTIGGVWTTLGFTCRIPVPRLGPAST